MVEVVVAMEIDNLRDGLRTNISALQTMSEVVEYETGIDREQHIRPSDWILRT